MAIYVTRKNIVAPELTVEFRDEQILPWRCVGLSSGWVETFETGAGSQYVDWGSVI